MRGPRRIDRRNLIGQGGTLCGDYLEVTWDAALVAGDRKIERALGSRDCFVLNLSLVFHNSHGRQIVFDLLESSQYVLSVRSDLIVIDGTRLVVQGAAYAHIEDSST